MMIHMVSLYTYYPQEMDEAGGGTGQAVMQHAECE